MWRYAGIEPYDVNNGLGVGVTLFMQGCARHCEGCHNPETWPYDGGFPYTREVDDDLFRILDDPNIVRLTISGGEPFSYHNVDMAVYVARRFKFYHPQKKLWLFSGFTLEQLKEDDMLSVELLTLGDVLVDGPFIADKMCVSLPFRGSRNQRVINLKTDKEIESMKLFSKAT